MAEQIRFLRRSWVDETRDQVTITASDPSASDLGNTSFLRNRSNQNGWATLGSTAQTNLVFIPQGAPNLTDIFILAHNLVNFSVEVSFLGAIVATLTVPTYNSLSYLNSSYFRIPQTPFDKLEIIMPDAQDKRIAQVVLCDSLGQFESWFEIETPSFDKINKISQLASGKNYLMEQPESFSVDLSLVIMAKLPDISLIQRLFLLPEGFHVSLCGGDDSQFLAPQDGLKGYRLQDLFFMRFANNWNPKLYKSVYKTGLVPRLKLIEAII